MVAVVLYRGGVVLPEERTFGLVFPGGKVEGRETIADAARREIYEELGVRLTSRVRTVSTPSYLQPPEMGLVDFCPHHGVDAAKLHGGEKCVQPP